MNHQILEPFCRISFWKDNVAADQSEAWTRCTISARGSTVVELEFLNTADGRHQRDRVVRLMRDAYERGKLDAKAEMRRTLGLD